MTIPKIASFVLATACLGLIVALPGCEHGSFDFSGVDFDDPRPNPRVESVTIIPDSLTLSVGQTATLRALVTFDNGSVLSSAPADFSSSDTTVATVSITDSGSVRTAEVTGRAIGTAWITAVYGDKSDQARVTVN